jgi:hypothetical protein
VDVRVGTDVPLNSDKSSQRRSACTSTCTRVRWLVEHASVVGHDYVPATLHVQCCGDAGLGVAACCTVAVWIDVTMSARRCGWATALNCGVEQLRLHWQLLCGCCTAALVMLLLVVVPVLWVVGRCCVVQAGGGRRRRRRVNRRLAAMMIPCCTSLLRQELTTARRLY